MYFSVCRYVCQTFYSHGSALPELLFKTEKNLLFVGSSENNDEEEEGDMALLSVNLICRVHIILPKNLNF